MARGKRTNPVVLRPGMDIGTGNAESDDEFLFDCFVHYPAVEQCVRMQSPGRVISGRTGSGKTAILRYIQTTEDYATDIDPAEMAMSYVANSDALRFLNAIGADLDLLFQVLWKHVLCIEFIRLRWSVENEEKSHSVFQRLIFKFSKDERKKKAIKYLKDWEGKFWITMDQNIKEITETVENKLNAEFGAEIDKFKAGGQYEKRLSSEKKSEIVARARNIINADQLSELHGIIEILAENSNSDDMHRCYILIDKLDERWVDVSIRFRLIRALLSSLKSFNKITNLKILVSMRTDILERVVQETNDITFQREKFEDYFVRIKWSKTDLKSLVDKRMRALFKRQYTAKPISFDDVFTYSVKNKDPFDYIIERTLMRPRDVIAFVNECIAQADGHYEISPKQIQQAEVEYARKRRDALLQEWRSAFPTLNLLLNFVTSKRAVSVNIQQLCDSPELDDLALGIAAQSKIDFDPMFEMSQEYMDSKNPAKLKFVREVVAVLYRAGALGVKLSPTERFLYSYSDDPIISRDLLDFDSKVRIHPMLHGAFRLSDGERPRRGDLADHT